MKFFKRKNHWQRFSLTKIMRNHKIWKAISKEKEHSIQTSHNKKEIASEQIARAAKQIKLLKVAYIPIKESKICERDSK